MYPSDVPVDFIEGVFDISRQFPILASQAVRASSYSLVIVDTSPAYFTGDEENSNTALGHHARSVLRPLTTLQGGPCVIANTHPVKNATNDHLLPRGGGAFLAEVDIDRDGNHALAVASRCIGRASSVGRTSCRCTSNWRASRSKV